MTDRLKRWKQGCAPCPSRPCRPVWKPGCWRLSRRNRRLRPAASGAGSAAVDRRLSGVLAAACLLAVFAWQGRGHRKALEFAGRLGEATSASDCAPALGRFRRHRPIADGRTSPGRGGNDDVLLAGSGEVAPDGLDLYLIPGWICCIEVRPKLMHVSGSNVDFKKRPLYSGGEGGVRGAIMPQNKKSSSSGSYLSPSPPSPP